MDVYLIRAGAVGAVAGLAFVAWHRYRSDELRVALRQARRELRRARGDQRRVVRRRTHARIHVLLLVPDLNIRVINETTGELIRELTLNPDTDYEPRTTRQTDTRGFGLSPMS